MPRIHMPARKASFAMARSEPGGSGGTRAAGPVGPYPGRLGQLTPLASASVGDTQSSPGDRDAASRA